MTQDSQLSESDYSEYSDSDSDESTGESTSESAAEMHYKRKRRTKILGAHKKKKKSKKKASKKKSSKAKEISSVNKFTVGFWDGHFRLNRFIKKSYKIGVAVDDDMDGLSLFDAFTEETILLISSKAEAGGLYCLKHFDLQTKDGHKKNGIILQKDDFEDAVFQKKAIRNGGTTIYVAFSGDADFKNCDCGGWKLATAEYQKKWEDIHEEVMIITDSKKVKASQVFKDIDNKKVDMAEALNKFGVDPKSALMAMNVKFISLILFSLYFTALCIYRIKLEVPLKTMVFMVRKHYQVQNF